MGIERPLKKIARNIAETTNNLVVSETHTTLYLGAGLVATLRI
jgi:hypothetical protein